MNDKRYIIYETPEGKVESAIVPHEALMPTVGGDVKMVTINTRLDAMLWLKSEMELQGDSMGRYRIIKTKGFAPSKIELALGTQFGGRL